MRLNNTFAALNNSIVNQKETNKSLNNLSSGLRINKASDDASGLAIADKLRTHASGIKQSIANANSAVAMLNIADKGMSELSNILDIIKSKAIQMATGTTSEEGKKIIKTEILKLIENYDAIVCNTIYNNIPLLNDCASPFSFQVGDSSNDVINVKIDNVEARHMGEADPYKLKNFITGFNEISTSPSTPSIIGSSGSGLIFENGLDKLQPGTSNPQGNFMIELPAGTKDLTLYLDEFSAKDTMQIFTKDGEHVAGTPEGDTTSWQTGYSPEDIITSNSDKFNPSATYQNSLGTYQLDSKTDNLGNTTSVNYIDKNGDNQVWNMGSYDEIIVIPEVTEDLVVFINGNNSSGYQTSAEWRASASSNNTEETASCDCDSVDLTRNDDSPTLLIQAQRLLAVIDESLNQLNAQRSNIGSGINQIESSIRNSMTNYINTKKAESVIRDVDYALESSNFSKLNVIGQGGSLAQTKQNETQQRVLELLK